MQQSALTRALETFVEGLFSAIPRILTGVVFLVLAALTVKIIMVVVRFALRRTFPGESPVYRQFIATIVATFLWFAVGLAFLSLVGLTVIAGALGTATGFLALGVAYAVSGMLADAVAGFYLLRDPDFQPGDTITVGDVTGQIHSIELRKTRLTVEEDTVIRANEVIEQEWRKAGPPAE